LPPANAPASQTVPGNFVQFKCPEGQQSSSLANSHVTSINQWVNADELPVVWSNQSGAVYSPSLVETDIARRWKRKAIFVMASTSSVSNL